MVDLEQRTEQAGDGKLPLRNVIARKNLDMVRKIMSPLLIGFALIFDGRLIGKVHRTSEMSSETARRRIFALAVSRQR